MTFWILGFLFFFRWEAKEFFIVYIKLRDKELSYAEEEDKWKIQGIGCFVGVIIGYKRVRKGLHVIGNCMLLDLIEMTLY